MQEMTIGIPTVISPLYDPMISMNDDNINNIHQYNNKRQKTDSGADSHNNNRDSNNNNNRDRRSVSGEMKYLYILEYIYA